VPALIDQLRSSDPATSRQAADALGELGDRRALLPLVTLSIDDDSPAADAAVTAVGRLGGMEALAALQSLLPQDEATKRSPRADRRGTAQHKEAASERFAALSVLIADPAPEVRAAALMALGGLDDPRGIGLAVAGLRDDDPGVRSVAAGALGKLGTAIAVESLLTALDDPDPSVRRAVVEALGTAGGPRATEALNRMATEVPAEEAENDRAIREAARTALSRLAAPHPDEAASRDDV
jgi:HEAT repeat protein